MPERFRIEPLADRHDRSRFSCGSAALDRYIRERASEDVNRRIVNCFVAVGARRRDVAGYYTLAAAGVALDPFAPRMARKLSPDPVVPAAVLGHLAVAHGYQGEGLGGILLADAVLRTARADLGIFALLAEAKDKNAERFCEHYGFTLLPGEVRRLCLPLATAISVAGERNPAAGPRPRRRNTAPSAG